MPFDGVKTNDRIVRVLQGALDFYEGDERKWIQGAGLQTYADGRSRRCLANVISLASHEFNLQRDVINVLARNIDRNCRGTVLALDAVIYFNDTHTFPEVIALINKAIASR